MLKSDTKKILAIAIPSALNNFLDMLQVLIDMLFIGKISPIAIASVGLSMQFIGFLYTIITIFSVGTNALVARFYGAKEYKKAEILTFNNIIFSFLLSLPITVLIFTYSYDFFILFGNNEEVAKLSTSYMKIISISIPFLFIGAVLVSTSNGYGDTKTPLIVGIIGNTINTILDYLLIFGNFGFPRLEVVGAGIATTIAYISEVIIYIYLVKFRKLYKVRNILNFQLVKKSLKIGIPTGLERFIIYSSFLFFVWIISQYGAYTLAGYQIGLRVEGLAFMPGFGFAIASMTLVGQSIGEGNYQKAYKFGIKTSLIAGIVMQILGIFMFFFPEFLCSFFTSDKKTIEQASVYLKVVAISQFPLAVDFVISGALRGAGATKLSLIVNTLCLWIFRLIPAFLITIYLKDLLLVYIIMVLETFIKGFVIWYIFKRGSWKKIEV